MALWYTGYASAAILRQLHNCCQVLGSWCIDEVLHKTCCDCSCQRFCSACYIDG